MRFIEFLIENISISNKREKIDDAIKLAIKETLHDTTVQFNSNISSESDFEMDRVTQILNHYIPSRLKTKITNALMRMGIEINPLLRKVQFIELRKTTGGQAGYDYITIQYSILADLIDKVLRHLLNEIYNTELSKKEIAKTIYTSNCIDNCEPQIKEIRDTFIHEMVHITQHARHPEPSEQNKWKSPEYRSYLTRNKKRFHDALTNLTSQEDWNIYYASPQEIPAHAHNMALNLMDITGKYSNDMNIEDMKFLLFNIIDILKDFRNWINDPRYEQYKEFNKPNTKQYKIYKRFMKIVYLELVHYKEFVEDKIKHSIHNKKEEQDYETWLNSMENM